MKRPNFFKSLGAIALAGAFTFSIASCDNQREASDTELEDVYGEDPYETPENTDLNNDNVSYRDGGEWDYDREYAYTDRTMYEDRLRYDIDRADQSLERLDTRMEEMGDNIEAETRREWEETKTTLQRERDQLNMRLQEVENATENTWQDVRNNVNETFRNWDREWDELRNSDLDVDVDVNDDDEM
jgi:hypothetical protein